MAQCPPFDVEVQGDVTTAFQKVKARVEGSGGQLVSDQNAGTILGTVPLMGALRAEYSVAGSTVTVTVTQKPLLVPCSSIQAKVEEFFDSAG